jgi:nitrite reductase (NADH) small subunit
LELDGSEAMPEWVRLCAVTEAPSEGQLVAADAGGKSVCLARLNGKLFAVDNICPHRQAPLAEGWIEDGKLICPWHSWSFDLETGASEYPEGEQIPTFAVRVDGGAVLMRVLATDRPLDRERM